MKKNKAKHKATAKYTNFQKWLKKFDPLDVAQVCGVSRQHVYKWRSGTCMPSDKLKALIVEHLSDGRVKYEDFYYPIGHFKNIKMANIAKKYRTLKRLSAPKRKRRQEILEWKPQSLYDELGEVRRVEEVLINETWGK
jgi:DNA-binding XRE family transcriptional regulator